MHEQSAGGAESPSDQPLSRRTVLRTAAHAAWAVPAIQLVSAAPAFAASGDTLAFAGTPSWASKKILNVSFVVTNTSPGTQADGLTVTLTMTPAPTAGITLPIAGAWTIASAAGGVVTLTAGSIAAGAQSPFTLRLEWGNASNRTVTISGNVTTTSTSDFGTDPFGLFPTISTSN